MHIKNKYHKGYITIKGGHRIGITGTCVIENQKISNIKYISSLNFRIAREVKDVVKNIKRHHRSRTQHNIQYIN